MSGRRVVITGTGAITSIGHNVREIWENALSGTSGIGRITRFETDQFPSKIAGEIKDFDINKHISPKEARRLDPFCHYAIVAADEAVSESGIDFSSENKARVAVVVGSGIGGILTLEKQLKRQLQGGPSKVSPFLVPMMIGDMASGVLAIRYQVTGPNFGVTSACATGNHAIGEAFWLIKRGDADVTIAGGTEACISPVCAAGFSSMKALSMRNDSPQSASRPYDAKRDGFVLAEGAGVLILESLPHALERKAKILAELVGYGATADAYHITSPPPTSSGATAAIKMAMEHAGIRAEDIDYINSHGTGTVLNDKCETLAIKNALGAKAYDIPISSTKSLIGHSLGAAGAIESILCVKTIIENTVPGTYNYEYEDSDCDLNYVPNQSLQTSVQTALNMNFGFGGHNAVTVFKNYENQHS